MLVHLLAGVIAAAASYPPHLLLEGHVSVMADYLITSVIGGGVYVYAFLKIRQLKGDL